jgi:hypothetical protein
MDSWTTLTKQPGQPPDDARNPSHTLDADGLELPSDWYLRLAREITRMFHAETQPSEKMPLMN